jgi:hypothetical protein
MNRISFSQREQLSFEPTICRIEFVSAQLRAAARCAWVKGCHEPAMLNVRSCLPAQPVDATQALNLSAGVSNCKVSRGLSLS